MCPAINFPGYEIHSWKPIVYEAAAATFRVADQLQSGARNLTLTAQLWKLDRLLRSFLTRIYETPKTTANPATEADVKWAIEKLREISSGLEEMYANAKRCGLTNRTFMGAVLASIRTQTDDILDLAETLELAINPRVDQRFAEAEQEYERGQTVPLSSLR